MPSPASPRRCGAFVPRSVAAILATCSSLAWAAAPPASCDTLTGVFIPASAFALPTSGATVAAALLVPANPTSGVGEYCQLTGSIAAFNPEDPAIKFQVNLPTEWNGKALQLGGGGFNGVVVSGLGNVSHTPPGTPTPLARGYATFGSDSGSTPDGRFGMNAQALANYGGESVKRTHDLGMALIKQYYKRKPKRTYHAGGSKGGHEGLVAVQRYGKDYDGVIAYYPANQNQAMVLSWFRMWEAAYRQPGGYLNLAKQQLLKSRVLAACDALDGLADGIVGNTKACDTSFSVETLRCPGGSDDGDTCLSDPQIATLMTGVTPMQFAFPLAYGVTSIGPYPVFHGGDITGIWLDTAGVPQANAYFGFTDAVIRFFDQQDPDSTTVGFDYREWQPRVEEISQIYDATNPDIDEFLQRRGKLLIVQGTTDMLVPDSTTTQYVERLKSRYGASLRRSARYYVMPGFGHAGGTFTMAWDSLAALENWVEGRKPPSGPVAVDVATATAGRQRPLCEYPLFPKYKGSGDVNSADSFACALR